MLKAIVEGKRDAGWMADYARGALRSKRRELKSALEGSFTNNQRWLLDKELSQLEWLEAQLQVLEQEIERRVEPFEQAIRHLITIPGVERKAAWTVVAEVGADMSVFADSRHLASWAGLCPGNRESGGKRISGRTRKANRYVRRALCQAAWAASHTRNTLISALYRRIQVRKGAPKAVMAVAHHLITVIHSMLLRGEDYIELGADYYDRKNKPRVASRLLSRLSKLGYFVELRPINPEPVPSAPVAAYSETTHVVGTETPAPIIIRKRDRPCKCAERGIKCKHQTFDGVKSLTRQPSSPGRFS
jgi:transposase